MATSFALGAIRDRIKTGIAEKLKTMNEQKTFGVGRRTNQVVLTGSQMAAAVNACQHITDGMDYSMPYKEHCGAIIERAAMLRDDCGRLPDFLLLAACDVTGLRMVDKDKQPQRRELPPGMDGQIRFMRRDSVSFLVELSTGGYTLALVVTQSNALRLAGQISAIVGGWANDGVTSQAPV